MLLTGPITIATRGGALHFLVARTGSDGQAELAFHTDPAGHPPRFLRPDVLQSICGGQRALVAEREWDYGTRLAFARNLVTLAAIKIQLRGVQAAVVWELLNEADSQFVALILGSTRRGDRPYAETLIGLAVTRYNSAILARAQGTPQHVAAIAANVNEVLDDLPQNESPQEREFLAQALGML